MSGAGASGSKRLPSEVLKDWPSVDIDEEGVFKYVLIEAYAEDEKDGQVCYNVANTKSRIVLYLRRLLS
jgi:hypothetical protein